MPKSEQIPIKKNLDLKEINRIISDLEKYTRTLKRLYFIKYRYQGMSVEAAARQVGITKSVAYTWQKRWNEDGYEGIIPRHAGGRPSKLSDFQKDVLKDMLNQKEAWTTNEVRELILHEFNVEYTPKQIRIILKNTVTGNTRSYDCDSPENGDCNLCQSAIR